MSRVLSSSTSSSGRNCHTTSGDTTLAVTTTTLRRTMRPPEACSSEFEHTTTSVQQNWYRRVFKGGSRVQGGLEPPRSAGMRSLSAHALILQSLPGKECLAVSPPLRATMRRPSGTAVRWSGSESLKQFACRQSRVGAAALAEALDESRGLVDVHSDSMRLSRLQRACSVRFEGPAGRPARRPAERLCPRRWRRRRSRTRQSPRVAGVARRRPPPG